MNSFFKVQHMIRCQSFVKYALLLLDESLFWLNLICLLPCFEIYQEVTLRPIHIFLYFFSSISC